jgi:hypothetical protein
VNVWQDTTLSDCDVTQKFVQFLIVTDGELQMTRDDTSFLVVPSGIASKFENFSCKVLKHGCEVYWGTSTNALSIVALSQKTVDTADRESETGF